MWANRSAKFFKQTFLRYKQKHCFGTFSSFFWQENFTSSQKNNHYRNYGHGPDHSWPKIENEFETGNPILVKPCFVFSAYTPNIIQYCKWSLLYLLFNTTILIKVTSIWLLASFMVNLNDILTENKLHMQILKVKTCNTLCKHCFPIGIKSYFQRLLHHTTPGKTSKKSTTLLE